MDVNPTLPSYGYSAPKQTAVKQQDAAAPAAKQEWQPAPPLRPTVQDRIDIDQRLLALRHTS